MRSMLFFVLAIILSPLVHAQSQANNTVLSDPKIHGGILDAIDGLSSLDSIKRPLALVSGNLLLRDATYRYNESVTEEGAFVIFGSMGCDIFQVVLTVTEGAVTLVMTETDSSTQSAIEAGTFIYPDKLTAQSGMFAYTLYSNSIFKLVGIKNGDFDGDKSSAKVTAFSYCFSTKPAAFDSFSGNNGIMY